MSSNRHRSISRPVTPPNQVIAANIYPSEKPNMDVGKCGDADTVCTQLQSTSNIRQRWSDLAVNSDNASVGTSISNPHCDIQKINQEIDQQPVVKKCNKNAFLEEPPKLRRALAHLDLDDGDCERDEDSIFNEPMKNSQQTSATSVEHPDIPHRTKLQTIYHQLFGMHRNKWFNNHFTDEPSSSYGKIRFGPDDQSAYKHKPKRDLFHQFKNSTF